jgi:hypothetical protein
VRFGLAHVWLVVAALFAAAIGVSRPVSFALVAATALASGHALAAHLRLGITLAAWAIWTGFFENTLGLLTFSVPQLAGPPSADVDSCGGTCWPWCCPC